jgi:predicted site-specific integrase-resolvase
MANRDLLKYTRRAVAERLGVTPKTVDSLARNGKLRKVRLSARKVYIDPASLKELLGDNLFAELFDESAET